MWIPRISQFWYYCHLGQDTLINIEVAVLWIHWHFNSLYVSTHGFQSCLLFLCGICRTWLQKPLANTWTHALFHCIQLNMGYAFLRFLVNFYLLLTWNQVNVFWLFVSVLGMEGKVVNTDTRELKTLYWQLITWLTKISWNIFMSGLRFSVDNGND